jgi:hypothetical protein
MGEDYSILFNYRMAKVICRVLREVISPEFLARLKIRVKSNKQGIWEQIQQYIQVQQVLIGM